MTMNYYHKVKHFSFLEKIKIFKYSLGSLLANSIPKGLKHMYHFLQDLENQNIKIIRKNGFVEFLYPKTNNRISLKQNSSDSKVFEQILIQEEYKPVIELINKYNLPMQVMIDAGANVGFTTLYFKNHFSNLKIISLEPSLTVFERLKRNIQINSFKNIILYQKGLWSKSARLKADRTFRDGEDWAFRIVEAKESEDADIETLSINDIIYENGIDKIDFLKIDIEGSEKEVFNDLNSLNWLNLVQLLAIEIHDEFDCREHIEKILVDRGFELSYAGELTIGLSLKQI
jgi:FkbM family methyltransferase